MKKINFKKPKYILPLIAFLPLNFMAYEVCNMFSDNDATKRYTDLNVSLPDANDRNLADKSAEMQRLGIGNAITGVQELEKLEKDTLQEKDIYTDEELARINNAASQKKQVQEELRKLEQSLRNSQDKINGTSRRPSAAAPSSPQLPSSNRADEMDSYAKEIEKLQSRAMANSRRLLGLPPYDDAQDRQRTQAQAPDERTAQPPQEGRQDSTTVVEKVKDGSENFHTVGGREAVDAALIKAMIDQQTKVHEGTRLRFRLLDDVEIQGMRLPKGSYLYGTVNGFSKQRVKAAVTSILMGDTFIKVNLSVYDVDGMEGFYVPESAFRDFMRNAGSQAVQQNMNIRSNDGSTLNAETVALQALQNIYTSATQAVSQNIRKNKARIKYNSIVYLINAKN